jgi:hypothetical protein
MSGTDQIRSLGGLETDVLEQIAAHRQAQRSAGTLPIALLVAITALATGLLTGISEPNQKPIGQGSEAALLADDVGLAPSSLLASNQ